MAYANQLQYFVTNDHQWSFYVIGGMYEIAIIFQIIILTLALSYWIFHDDWFMIEKLKIILLLIAKIYFSRTYLIVTFLV